MKAEDAVIPPANSGPILAWYQAGLAVKRMQFSAAEQGDSAPPRMIPRDGTDSLSEALKLLVLNVWRRNVLLSSRQSG